MSKLHSQAEHLRWQAGWCTKLGSPLYEALFERAAADIEAGGPVASVLGDREATQRSMLGLRLMGAVHRLVLEGRAPDLAAFYPSVGGRPDADLAWAAFRALLADRPEEVRSGIDHPVQTNEAGRATALVGGFLEVARAAGLPLRILEVGASAGLHLRWDYYFFEARGLTWGPPDSPVRLCSYNGESAPPFHVNAKVVERRGCDTEPVDPTTEDGGLTLLSYVWPDQVGRHRLLRAALDVARRLPAEVETAHLIDWAGRHAEPVEGTTTVVYHSVVMQYLTEEDSKRFGDLLRARGRGTTSRAPLAWLQMEPGGEQAEVGLTVWPGGEERILATTGYHGQNVRWLLPSSGS
jgi:hypothetical protein